MAEVGNEPKLRVFLWTQPRSLGTVLSKCMSFVDGVQIINEPMVTVNNFGPESKGNEDFTETVTSDMMSGSTDVSKNVYDQKKATFSWTKQMLESPFPGKSLVFVHDQAFCVREDQYTDLPRGYRHTFLIRNPLRVFPSWKKAWEKLMPGVPFVKFPTNWLSPKRGFGELFDLSQYVQQQLKEPPIIIDADDLLSNPKSILSKYCNLTGIEFTESLLKWEAGDQIVDTWITSQVLLKGNNTEKGGYYENAFKSTEFLPPPEMPSLDEIDDDLRPMIDQCMPVYQKMYSQRIQP